MNHPSIEGKARGGNEAILVADDEELIRNVSKEILESFSYRVFLAKDGIEAVSLYEKHREELKLVILDMVMPRMGGRETFLKLKDLNPGIRVILSTGYGKEGRAQELLELGVMEFIQKPYGVDAVLDKVRSVLDLS